MHWSDEGEGVTRSRSREREVLAVETLGLHNVGVARARDDRNKCRRLLAELEVQERLDFLVVREDPESVGHESCRPRALEELHEHVRALRTPTDKSTGQIEM